MCIYVCVYVCMRDMGLSLSLFFAFCLIKYIEMNCRKLYNVKTGSINGINWNWFCYMPAGKGCCCGSRCVQNLWFLKFTRDGKKLNKINRKLWLNQTSNIENILHKNPCSGRKSCKWSSLYKNYTTFAHTY